MNSTTILSKASTSLVSNSYKARLAMLLDYCELIQAFLDAGQVEDAKFFLKEAIVDAKTVSKEQGVKVASVT